MYRPSTIYRQVILFPVFGCHVIVTAVKKQESSVELNLNWEQIGAIVWERHWRSTDGYRWNTFAGVIGFGPIEIWHFILRNLLPSSHNSEKLSACVRRVQKRGYYTSRSNNIKCMRTWISFRNILGKYGIRITTRGQRHFGAIVGSPEYREEYKKKKMG